MKVKIKDFEYEIIEVDEYDDGLLNNGQYQLGVHSWRKSTIRIPNNLDVLKRRHILKHELTHAFIQSTGFSQVDWNEEIVCDFLEHYSEDILKIVDEYFKK